MYIEPLFLRGNLWCMAVGFERKLSCPCVLGKYSREQI
jgi:hypothetical protein